MPPPGATWPLARDPGPAATPAGRASAARRSLPRRAGARRRVDDSRETQSRWNRTESPRVRSRRWRRSRARGGPRRSRSARMTASAAIRPPHVERRARGRWANRGRRGHPRVPASAAGPPRRGTDAIAATELEAIPFGSTATCVSRLSSTRRRAPARRDRLSRAALARPADPHGHLGLAGSGRVARRRGTCFAALLSLSQGPARSDDELVQLARAELRVLMGSTRSRFSPGYFRGLDRASPLMRVGHLARVRELRERLSRVAPGLHLAGGGYEGIGIPDSVRQGRGSGPRGRREPLSQPPSDCRRRGEIALPRTS